MSLARARAASFAATLVLGLLAACSDGGTDPTPTPTPDPIADQIDALWPAGTTQDQALALLAELRAAATASNSAVAEAKAFALTTLTLSEFRAGHLQGGAAQLPTLLDTFVSDLFALASLPDPGLSAASFGPDGLVEVVDGSGGTFVTTTKFAGISIPAAALGRSVLLVVDRLPDSSQYALHQGPLPTTLDQYPLFYHYSTTPAVTFFSADVIIGICQVTDSLSQFYIPDAIFPRIQLAHPDPTTPTTIELLNRVDAPFLDCTDVGASAVRAESDAALLAATRPGISGRVRKFSPFGAVDPGAPAIGLSPTAVTFTAAAGGASPAAQNVAVSNTGTGTLSGLTVGTITFGAGATDWLAATLDQTTAPATLTLTPALGALAVGTYTATVPVTAAAASNSPQAVTVTFSIAAGTPMIGLAPAAVTFTAPAGGANPAAQDVAVTNTGTGTLAGLAVGTVTYGAGATGWLAATLNQTTAPATLTLTPTLGALAVGTYTATFPVMSAMASNSPQTMTVEFVVGAAPLLFSKVQAGYLSTCALESSGQAYCWGSGSWGELGNGLSGSTVPVKVDQSSGVVFQDLAFADQTGCGLTSAGLAWCWGFNLFGQVGRGQTTNPEPLPVPMLQPSGVVFTQIAMQQATCAASTTGQAYCWGSNANGETGRGVTGGSFLLPGPVLQTGGLLFSTVTTGALHACALTPAGLAYCWGSNDSHQLGYNIGSATSNPQPGAVNMPSGVTFVQLRAGHKHTCGLTASGQVYCWGDNSNGQLGIGTTTSTSTVSAVLQPAGTTFVDLTLGSNGTCGLTAAGQAWCWGWNADGQLGDGTAGTDRLTPVAVQQPAGLSFAALSLGFWHTCGLSTDGRGYCWGRNYEGQIGDGTTTDHRLVPTPVVQ